MIVQVACHTQSINKLVHRRGEFLPSFQGVPSVLQSLQGGTERNKVFLLKDKTNSRYLCKTETENVQNGGIQIEALSSGGGGSLNTDLWFQLYFFMFGTSENTSAFQSCQHK